MNVREWALPVYTILIQMASGALLCLWIIRSIWSRRYSNQELDRILRICLLIIFVTICLGIAGAHLHLSKPLFSLLAVRNVGHSWLSREIVSTVILFSLTAALIYLTWFVPGKKKLKDILGWAASIVGLVNVYCMARVYMLPTQLAWNSSATVLSYFTETFLLGTTALAAILLMELNFTYEQNPERAEAHANQVGKASTGLGVAAFVSLVFTLLFIARLVLELRVYEHPSAEASVTLLLNLYLPLLVTQFALGIAGVVWLLFNLWRNQRQRLPIRDLIGPAYIAITLVLVGGILGRFLFYAIHVRTGI